jgi:hypothetical protein
LREFHNIISNTEKIFPFPDSFFEGSWYGNDTIPRTVVDLNRIVQYCNKDGIMKDKTQRKHFVIVDAIIAGEGEGPVEPTDKSLNTLVAGFNPCAVDLVCSQILQFDYKKIPLFNHALKTSKYPIFNRSPHEIEIYSEHCSNFFNTSFEYGIQTKPTKGWKDHIELKMDSSS